MRTWGRVPLSYFPDYAGAIGSFSIGVSGIGASAADYPNGYHWIEVSTDENGLNDAVWLTTLAQVLQLGLNESPIYGNYGIPAQQSVLTQIIPDYYATLTQQYFSVYFLALILSRNNTNPPTYQIDVTANPGAILINPVPT